MELQIDDQIRQVPISQILVNPNQPRKDFKSEDLEELAQSIETVGLLHPLVVRPVPNSDTYELISGERRFHAAKLAGMSLLPVYIRKIDYILSAQASLIENIQRVDLNPIEIARAFKRLMIEFGFTQDQLAQKIGKKRSTIANYLRLLSLPQSILESVKNGSISMGHAKAILAINLEDKKIFLHDMIIRNHLSVRQSEKIATQLEKRKKEFKSYHDRDFDLERLESQMRDRFGTKVTIRKSGKKGEIKIDYYTLEDLDRLLVLFGMQNENEHLI